MVLRELLPTAPIPQEVIWRDEAFDNSTPLQLVAVERRRRSSLGTGTRSVTAPAISASSRVHPVTFDSVSMENPDATICVVSLGPHEERWRSVTSWLGQPRVLNPALPLHGLRELPFHIQLGSVGVMIEVTFGVLFVLLGPGFALGLVEDICTSGSQTVAESLFFGASHFPADSGRSIPFLYLLTLLQNLLGFHLGAVAARRKKSNICCFFGLILSCGIGIGPATSSSQNAFAPCHGTECRLRVAMTGRSVPAARTTPRYTWLPRSPPCLQQPRARRFQGLMGVSLFGFAAPVGLA